MSLIAAKCSQCGANLEIDTTKQKHFCKNCGTEFIDEKINNNNITNVQHQTNVYYNNKVFNLDKEIEVLKLLFYSMDFTNLKNKALEIVDYDNSNALAKMIYSANFSIANNINSVKLVEFENQAILDYFESHSGEIDLKFSEFILKLFIRKVSKFDINNVFNIIIKNIEKLNLTNNEINLFYKNLVSELCYINDNFIEQNINGESSLKSIADNLNFNNTNFAYLICKTVGKDNDKKSLIISLKNRFDVTKYHDNDSSSQTSVNSGASIAISIIVVVFIIALMIGLIGTL